MKPYLHQLKIIEENKTKTGLFLGTGSGKSFCALALAKSKTLVVCPKTIKEDMVWERQLKQMDLPLDLTVISKENFRKNAHLLDSYQSLIIDEAETCLGATPALRWVKKEPRVRMSQLCEELFAFVERTQPERLYLLTATITRSPMTVWAAGKLLGYDWNFYTWRDAFYYKLDIPGRNIYIPKKDNETKDRLAKAVQKIGYVGRLEDYFDVPEQTYRTIYVELTKEQKDKLQTLPAEFPDPIVLLGKKHQVEQGHLKGDEFSKAEYFKNEKIKKLEDFAVEFPRMIVYAKYIGQIEQIKKAMEEMGKEVFVLDGRTEDRGELIRHVDSLDDYVFICQCQIGAGWELSKCPVIVFASMSYSIVDYLQSLGRIHRANNLKKNLYIHLVVKGGIDNEVYKSIMNKQDFNERIYLKL